MEDQDQRRSKCPLLRTEQTKLFWFEFIYLVHSCFINWDTEMYYAEKDTPAKARSTSLNDQLGQIEYIFSDKTGTLTQNIMTFKKCCIHGIIYGKITVTLLLVSFGLAIGSGLWATRFFKEHSYLFAFYRHTSAVSYAFFAFWGFLILLSLVIPMSMLITFVLQTFSQAAFSIDIQSVKLTEEGRSLGYSGEVVCEEPNSRLHNFVGTLEWHGEKYPLDCEKILLRGCRVRNTAVCYGLVIYAGFDTKIMKNCGKIKLKKTKLCHLMDRLVLLDLSWNKYIDKNLEFYDQLLLDTIRRDQDPVVREYMRLLALCHTVMVEEKEMQDPEGCIKLYTKGADSVILERLHSDRTNEDCTVKALDLLGATAIEDKLQNGVPETIHLLKRGGIKVWVLTGDKQETAVNIGFACQLLSEDMTILEESEIRYRVLKEKIFHTVENKKSKEKKGLLEHLRFRIKDTSKEHGYFIEKAFVELATTCQAVICCRVTPKQKALIVQMVKRHKNPISLAIGDGANDVNMIKTADIGVGISGQEGMQAVQCSDYALAQFRYLQRLLFVHGKWSYIRICKFLRYFFFKTFAGMMVQIWFAFYTGFTAQDVNAKKSLQFPELYKAGQKDLFFNFWIFFVSFIHGSFVSLANFYITMWAMGDRSGVRVTGDYQSYGMVVATSAILTVLTEMFQAREMQKKQSTVELTSHNNRNSLLRRSSYAFSHKEGYAHLIAKGASLRSKTVPVRKQLNGLYSTNSPGKDNSLPTEINAAPKEDSLEQKVQLG
ncbi:PREDICTED: phospholipid-transporting ATPase IK-like [Thamnophis sirtalis]|uniref:P-type phospholipid transporter n=1 Tax=Thamnophis sirtalis TaxID=35019 RepID=A0A6I9YKB0_9SAUR|nr:PREDICTED: phospholipid-transporting ATPase IK-like [Thamnophis sirtalis]